MVSLAIPHGKAIYATHGELALSSANRFEMNTLEPCSHEEADTRLMLHALDATLCGHRRIQVRSNDSDVVVLAISVASSISIDELWVAYGTGKHLCNTPAHSIPATLGRDKASALPMFHSITGCDTVSFFCGRGKMTAWDVWNIFPELQRQSKCLQHHLKTSTKSAWQQ